VLKPNNLTFASVEKAYDMFQRIAPGKYTVEERYNTEKYKFEFKLVFETPNEETVFYLKYGDVPMIRRVLTGS
jgi:hypothetical protein